MPQTFRRAFPGFAKHFDEFVHRVYMAIALLGIGLTVMLGLGMTFIQHERYESLIDGCVATSNSNDSIIRFLNRLGANDKLILVAEDVFPHAERKACERVAHSRVGFPY